MAKKVAIVGGGLAGLTAAYGLTAPEQKQKYDVTIHTMGWRLGGKGASGRNPGIHNRIEEHGLHIWFGCYENAFLMMTEIMETLKRPPAAPLSSLDTAFQPLSDFVLMENVEGDWRQWPIQFPTNDQKPGGVPHIWEYLENILGWLKKFMAGQGIDLDENRAHLVRDFISHISLHGLWEDVKGFFHHDQEPKKAIHVLDGLHDHLQTAPVERYILDDLWREGVAEMLGFAADLLWDELKDRLPQDDEARRAFIMGYLGITLMRGMLIDNIFNLGFDAINDVEGRAWFRKHFNLKSEMANDLAVNSPPLQAIYDASFAYRDGTPETPDLAAGCLVMACVRLPFAYKGAMVYEMQAGMGDTIMAPLYQVLLARGVKFEFFSQCVGVEADGDDVTSVTVSRQVNLKQGRYDPLVKVKDLICWPQFPHYDQIVEGETLKSGGINLEHYDSGWANTGGETVLKAGEDFDEVVFAAPLPTHRSICPALVDARPKWRNAVEHVGSVRTQCVQVWFGNTRQEMGFAYAPGIIGGFAEPFSSIADFSHLILREDWSSDDVNYLIYSCGTLDMSLKLSQAEGNALVYDHLRDFLANGTKPIWPRANDRGEPGFDWGSLWAPEGVIGEERLRHQYVRCNLDVSELYVLSTAQGTDHRPMVKAAGLKNLVFAGDWTDNGLNISSVEGTVMSGLQASRAISGYPEKVIGENPKHIFGFGTG